MKKTLFVSLMLVLFSLAAHADKEGKCGENVTYHFAAATGTLTIKGSGPMSEFPIKHSRQGVILAELTAPWKGFCNDIKSVVIEDGVTTIGRAAFLRCENLASVTIPNSVKDMSSGVFYECKSLNAVTIPNSVTNLHSQVFYGCTNLSSVTLSNSLTEIGYETFSGCTSLTSIDIPDGVTTIDRRAFFGCTSLVSVTFPNSVKQIKESAFKGCPLQKATGLGICHIYDINDKSLLDEVLRESFVSYSSHYVLLEINSWQNKGEFETAEQYRTRVNEATRNALVEDLMEKARQGFISNAKADFSKTFKSNGFTLGDYDADKQTFMLKSDTYGEKSVKVDLNDAPAFKEKFRSATYNPTFVIKDDRAVLSDLGISVGGKTYAVANPVEQDETANVAIHLPPLSLDFGENSGLAATPSKPIDLSIDQNIPVSGATNANTFAVIIGNENYKSVSKVAYAQNDARSFAEYCKKTLGLPEKNVRGYEDATYGMMVSALQDIQKIAQAYHGDIHVIFYYAGHGIPDNASKNMYLLPVDADGRQMDICLSLDKLYQDLGALNVKSVTVFLDACFSGALRGDGMLTAARGVAIKAKAASPQGNMVVMTAASGEQTAYPYAEKGHGMFTYYLLKKLRDTKGGCTLGELSTYLCDEVAKQSVVTNGREQTPTVQTSAGISEQWRNMKLR